MDRYTINIIFSVIMLTLVLIILWLFFSSEYNSSIKSIERGNKDKYIDKDIKRVKHKLEDDNRKRVYKYVKSSSNSILVEQHSNYILHPEYDSKDDSYYEYKVKAKRSKGGIIRSVIIDIILLGLVGFIIYANWYSKENNYLYNFNGSTYVTIRSGSMSEANVNNTYLEEYNLTNQIPTFSLIRLDEVKDTSTVRLYDVCAYRNSRGTLIVHRIIDEEVINNTRYFTFRGDNNLSSDYLLVSENDVLYKYTGVINVPLGYVVSYVSSSFGLLSMAYIFIALFILDCYDKKKDKKYLERVSKKVEELNKDYSYKDTKVITVDIDTNTIVNLPPEYK